MVCSRNPQSIVSLHSLITNQNILQCIVHRMSHMQLSGNIRRRHHDRKRFFAAIYLCMKIFLLAPSLIKLWFDLFRIVRFFKLFAHVFYLTFPSFLIFHSFFILSNIKKPSTNCKGRIKIRHSPFGALHF